ncbi:MAG: hypothetical protein WC791_02915 [Candidatus Paceibacterota bacterium]|jgi:type II secretory pathway pseudopilin PulG
MPPILNSKFKTISRISNTRIFATRKSAVSGQLSVVSCSASRTRGALLLELLVAVAILASILSISAQSVYTSLQSGKISSESDVATGLANETLEAVRAISDEKWQNIYDLAKATPFHVEQSGTKWATSTGSENIPLNTASYERSFVVNNVSRDPVTRLIETTYSGAHDDPSTQQVVVTVLWNGSGSPITISDYFVRWRNKVCTQTSWTGGTTGGGIACTGGTTYESSLNIATSTSLQICASGC